MGIKGLQKLIDEIAPSAISRRNITYYCGKVIAIDASVLLYQFMTTIVSADGSPLTNAEGEVTSHLVGILSRVGRMIAAGIKPVFVFDGKPPEDKKDELSRRKAARESAKASLEEALLQGDTEKAQKLAKRTVRVTPTHSQQALTLLQYLGIPCISAESEAEAQCVALAKAGLVDAVASSDLDVLAFGCPLMVRNLANSADPEVVEINLEKVLLEAKLSHESFVDLCILCGCDYTSSIESVGPKTAYKLICKYGSIDEILAQDKVREKAPENWPYKHVRELFEYPTVGHISQMAPLLRWPSAAEIDNGSQAVRYLVDKMQFDEGNASSKVAKIMDSRKKPKQLSIDSFLTVRSSRSPKTDKRQKR